ncbi:MAG: hypothetical protein A2176_07715 [Spirochaetes bacterium RBG_13_51_14]|nr:MAG: hypothetical protein A2176_07715 [Spirochaetes bacterium RBG_13_51_14]
MNNYRLVQFFFIVFLSAFFVRCSSGLEESSSAPLLLGAYQEVDPRGNIFLDAGGTGYEYYPVTIAEQDDGKNVSFQYNLDLQSNTRDVYFIFTNVSTSSSSLYPSIDSLNQNINQKIEQDNIDTLKTKILHSAKTGVRGKPEISEFNRNPYAFLNNINPVNMLLKIVPSHPRFADALNDTQSFKIDRHTSVAATCRWVVPIVPTASGNSKTLNIWVADDCYVGGTKAYLIDDTMVQTIAEKFLHDDTPTYDDDIYDWVTNIYGEEWGILPYGAQSQLISDDISNNEITILLFDIDNDNSTNGGVLGYFWAKDNFKKSSIRYSNERIMFYLDAVLLATPDGTWEISDYWPSQIVSTLAHEFQHMIHFYQKTVLRTHGIGSETWIDEMCSLATEDLVADKLSIDGPRGVSSSDPTAGSSPISKGRLPLYNYFNDYSVTNWYGGDFVLVSYSLNYALGAYLARNYGGAKFFRNVVQNYLTDYTAIESAISSSSTGVSENFSTMLQNWSIANLLSDKTDTSLKYKYNGGTTWFTDTLNYDYNLGSINLFNYYYDYGTGAQNGPYIYTTMRRGIMPPASNYYYEAGKCITGLQTWNLRLNSRVRMTVVVRDALPTP